MTTLFQCDFENGLLYDPVKGFDEIVVSGGTAEVNAASKYEGSYGCEITPLVSYKVLGYKAVNFLTRLRQAFWFNLNTLTLTDTRYFRLCRNYWYDLTQRVYQLLIYYNSPNFQLQSGLADNTGDIVTSSGYYTISSGWHLIETDWQAAVSGHFSLWLDGSLQETISCNNSNLVVFSPALGVCYPLGYASTGSFWIDYWRANDDGTLIGA